MPSVLDSAMQKLQDQLEADPMLRAQLRAAPRQTIQSLKGLSGQERTALLMRHQLPGGLALDGQEADEHGCACSDDGCCEDPYESGMRKLGARAMRDPEFARLLHVAPSQAIHRH